MYIHRTPIIYMQQDLIFLQMALAHVGSPLRLSFRFVLNSDPKAFIMRVLARSVSVILILSASAIAQNPAWAPAPGHVTIDLWPHGAPGAAPTTAAEVDTTTAKDRLIAGKPVIRLGNVSKPTLTVYAPKQNNTGAAIVVFPGGAYRILAIDL